MKKSLFIIIFLVMMSLFFVSCSKEETPKESYDGRIYDLSVNGDKSVIAKSVKEGNKYTLTLSGSGKVVDFGSRESIPWNPIVKAIDKVVIEDGVSGIGSYYFYSVPINEYFLPSSVKTIAKDAFNSVAVIYSYGEEITSQAENSIYYYSETKPSEYNKYFHMVNNQPVIWVLHKVLFIGNSFTYYTQSTNNPLVPYYFKELADSLSEGVIIDYVVQGSHNLTRFADNTDSMGKIVYEKLHSANDYTEVILQEQSTTPINGYKSFENAVTKIVNLVNETQKNCEVVLYETWGSPAGLNSTGHKTVGEMEQALRTAYENCAKVNDLSVNYVGKAFTYAYETLGINVYYSDNRHQNEIGAFLSACVHLGSLYHLDVRASNYDGGLDSETAKQMKELAYKVAFDLPLDSVLEDDPVIDTTDHLLVIAWYGKTATSGLTSDIMDNFLSKLKTYLKTQGYTSADLNTILIKEYTGNVGPSCDNIKKDGNVDIMVGWKSNVDTTGNLTYLEAYPGNDSIEEGITMGSISGRWIHRLTDKDLAKTVFDWIKAEHSNNLFQ